MALHWRVIKRPGITYSFSGDDDIWAFINNNLVMDLGGIHSASAGSFNVDDVPGTVDGQPYDFDYFIAERHSYNSTILVTLSITAIWPCSRFISINANPPTASIVSGDSVLYTVIMKDITGTVRHDFDSLITWSVLGTANTGFLKNASGGSNTFYGYRAYGSYKIVVVIPDLCQPSRSFYDTVTVSVTAGSGGPYRLYIEQDTVPDKWTPHPVTLVDISSGASIGYVCAVRRDHYDNLICFDSSVVWSTRDPSVATAAGAPGRPWIGVITRATSSLDSTCIIASHAGGVSDSVQVKIEPAVPVGIRFVNYGTDDIPTLIAIYSTAGRLVKSYNTRNGTPPLNALPTIVPGAYFVRITNKAETLTRRILLTR
jgi:fibro-slime domain-containing protein